MRVKEKILIIMRQNNFLKTGLVSLEQIIHMR